MHIFNEYKQSSAKFKFDWALSIWGMTILLISTLIALYFNNLLISIIVAIISIIATVGFVLSYFMLKFKTTLSKEEGKLSFYKKLGRYWDQADEISMKNLEINLAARDIKTKKDIEMIILHYSQRLNIYRRSRTDIFQLIVLIIAASIFEGTLNFQWLAAFIIILVIYYGVTIMYHILIREIGLEVRENFIQDLYRVYYSKDK